MVILGIDPGIAILGYGVIDYTGNKFATLDYGAIRTDSSLDMPSRLLKVGNEIEQLILKYKPQALSIEQLFFNKNVKTALQVTHARGVVIFAGARSGIEVSEYTPLQVKQSIVGYGRADKAQVQQMIKVILHLPIIPRPDDVADALAVAVCHAHSCNNYNFQR